MTPVMYTDYSGMLPELIEMYISYYKHRSERLKEGGISVPEIFGICVEELFFPSWQDPILSYISKKSNATLVRSYGLSGGIIIGYSFTYQRVYTPDGRIVDQTASGPGFTPGANAAVSTSFGVLGSIVHSDDMLDLGYNFSLDGFYIHTDLDFYPYDAAPGGRDIGFNIGTGVSTGLGAFFGFITTNERKVVYE